MFPGSCCGVSGGTVLGSGSQCGIIGVVDPVNYNICSLGPISTPSVPSINVFRGQSAS